MTHHQLLSLLPFALLLFILQTPQFTHAHGYLAAVSVDGELWHANIPNAEPTPTICRQVDSVEPVKGATNPNLSCGQNARLAALVAKAYPGSELQFWWKGGDGSNWPHNWGPILTYMASCDDTPCDKFDAANAAWFKIEQTALKPGNMTWYQENIMNGGPANVTIPRTIAPGCYLVRHELLGLHRATEIGGAEFYPSCTQLCVRGSQSGRARDSEKVAFPGCYTDTDKGIYVPNIFHTPLNNYTCPGPAVAGFVTAGSALPLSGLGSSSGSPGPDPKNLGDGGTPPEVLKPGSVLREHHLDPHPHSPRLSRISRGLVRSRHEDRGDHAEDGSTFV